MFAALLFDLDGTLADTERENAESVARALARRNRFLSPEEEEYIVGHGWREIYAFLEERGSTGYSFDALKQAAAEEKNAILEQRGLRVLPGARDAVARLRGHLALGVVTGSSRLEAEYVLRALEVRDLLGCVVTAEDTAHGKPFPDGYLLAARQLGHVPSRCVAIEDSHAGIQAAQAAGMRCIAVAAGNFAAHDQSAADLVIDTLGALTVPLLQDLFRARASAP